MDFDPKDIPKYLEAIKTLPVEEQQDLLKLVQRYEEAQQRKEATSSFLTFVKEMWPGFIYGRHHKIMAEAFDEVVQGKCKRLIINMPPRHTKSEFASYLLPAYFFGHFPNKKIIQTSHTAELAVGFGRKVRDLLGSKDFEKLFPGITLKSDSKAAGHWHTNKGGEYFAIGTEGKVTGKGADLLIIDDPHSEQEATLAEFDPTIYDKVFDWYTSGPRQRLQPGGAIIIVMTRWGKRDLTARVIQQSMKDKKTNEWKVIELPAILPSGATLWPEFWPVEEIESLKAELPLHKWMAQYMQNPTGSEASLIKRDDWQMWPDGKPLPPFDMIMQSWDTAFGQSDRSNYSACTTWGVFNQTLPDGRTAPQIMLIEAERWKLPFPELKEEAKRTYRRNKPDMVIIEAKAVGAPLIFELRRAGIPVSEYTPSRGNDKISRVNAITDIFASKFVWAVDTKATEEVIVECADFPAGENDDYVDTVAQALLKFRLGGWVGTRNDDEDDDEPRYHRRKADYY